MRTHPIVEYYQALRDSAPCLSRAATLPKGTKLGLGKRRAPGNTIILSQPYRRRVSTDRLNREGSQLAASLEGEPGPTPAGKTLPHSFPETSRFRRERARECVMTFRSFSTQALLSDCIIRVVKYATIQRIRKYHPFIVSDWAVPSYHVVVVVVVFTLTDRASTIPSNIRGCQSGTWSQRGTKVNGSHHGDNPLLRPTGIQIATKRYATLQAMAPTNSKMVHQTSFTPYREQPRSTRIVVAYPRPAFSATSRTNTFQPVLINNSKFLKATHRTKIRKIEIPRSMVVEALSC